MRNGGANLLGDLVAEEVKQRIAAADAGEIDSTPWEPARDELLDELKQIHSRGR